jgi:hypothetical protein
MTISVCFCQTSFSDNNTLRPTAVYQTKYRGDTTPGIMINLFNEKTSRKLKNRHIETYPEMKKNVKNQSFSNYRYIGNEISIKPNFSKRSSRQVLLSSGLYPQFANIGDSLFVVITTIDQSYSSYYMFKVYFSYDGGQTWSLFGGAYNTTSDLQYADIETIDDKYVVVYENNGLLNVYWQKYDLSENGFVNLPSTSGYTTLWGSITSDKNYYSTNSTWLYVTYIAYDATGNNQADLFYTHSEDNGVTWSPQLQLNTMGLGAYRPGIATAFTTPNPGTQVDFVITTWRDTLYNGYATKINVYDETYTSEIVLPSQSGASGWGHWAPTVTTFFGNIFVTSWCWWGSTNGTNINSDISFTFSSDYGTNWGSDYSWYYFVDNNDLEDSHPHSDFNELGYIGFTWKQGNSVYARYNTTTDWLNNWSGLNSIGSNVTSTNMTNSLILNNIFYTAYDDQNNVYLDTLYLIPTSNDPDLAAGSSCTDWQAAIVLSDTAGTFTADASSEPFIEGSY